jgi:iron(III) transport system permease protein
MITLWRRASRSLGGALGIAAFALFMVYPLARFLLLPLAPSLGPASESSGGAGIGVSAPAMWNSLRLGLGCAALAVPIGVAFAWLMERRAWPLQGLATGVLWLVFLAPSYIVTTGWQILFSAPAIRHGPAGALFFSAVGIVGLLALKGIPFACFAARASWRGMGAEIEDAARVHIAPRWRRTALLLRLVAPAAGAAAAVVFVESVQDFGVPATLGAQIHLPIVTYAIYQRLATTPVDFVGASALSWSLVAMALGAALVHLRLTAHYAAALVHGRARAAPAHPCGPRLAVAAAVGLALVAAFGLLIPGAALALAALGPALTPSGLDTAWVSLIYSTTYGAAAAFWTVLLAVMVIERRRKAGGAVARLVDLLGFANMAVPGLVLGAAYVIAFNSGFAPLFGTPLLLLIAYVAAQTPMMGRFLLAPLSQIHASLTDAARVCGLSVGRRLAEIHAPLLATPCFWGWAMAFGQIFFELPISELLYPPGKPPVGVELVLFNETLDYAAEARLALAGMLACLAVTAAVWLAVRELTRPPVVAATP